MVKEIYNQFQSGDFSLSKILGGGVKSTKKRIGQGLDFVQDVAEDSKMAMGGMAQIGMGFPGGPPMPNSNDSIYGTLMNSNPLQQ